MRWSMLIMAVTLLPTAARAAPCDKLNAARRQQAAKLFAATYPYACCDETLGRCLKQKKVCKLALRLRDDICRRLSRGQDPKKIKDALARRARSMTAVGARITPDITAATPVGPAAARVQVVVYACARCPFCAKVVPLLHRKVTSGRLKGKVRLYFRPFPIRTHKGSVKGGLAFVAAAQQRKEWPMLLKLYAEFDNFAPDKLASWAAAAGLDRAAFAKAMADKANRKLLVKAKKEGLRSGVKATPTLIINGRRYHGDLDPETLQDVLEEETDRVAGRLY